MPFLTKFGRRSLQSLCVLCAYALSLVFAVYAEPAPKTATKRAITRSVTQSQGEIARKSSGCVSCHTSTDEPTMHPTKTVHLACTECHGGNSSASIALGT